MKDTDQETLMRYALELARKAIAEGELPIAAVLTSGTTILCEAHNRVATTKYLTAHAENLLFDGARDLLAPMGLAERSGLTLYSTLEPCVMCCGATMTHNIGTVCYALESPGDGVLSILHAWEKKSEQLPFYRVPQIIGGVLRAESATLFRDFAQRHPNSRFAKWARQLYNLIAKTPFMLL